MRGYVATIICMTCRRTEVAAGASGPSENRPTTYVRTPNGAPVCSYRYLSCAGTHNHCEIALVKLRYEYSKLTKIL